MVAGIVFGSENEFHAMRQGALQDGTNTGALFGDRQGHVIASTDSASLTLPPPPVLHAIRLCLVAA